MRVAYFALRLITALSMWAGAASGFEIEDRQIYNAASESSVLRIISTADRAVFEPIIFAFQQANPGISVDYTITGTTDLMKAIYEENAAFDLAISSAMDLQTKLANDGFARSYLPTNAASLPDWAIWRDQLFAFTQEPAVMVVSDTYFSQGAAPQTRDALIALLRANPEKFRGRIGTYDVRRSGFGYLMATQDSRTSETFWRLMEVMGRLDAQLYCCSGEMIADVASGKLALAYNVLGSYAASELATTDGFQIVELTDFVNVMLRTVLIPSNATNVDDAQAMVDFLTALRTRPDLVAASGLPPVDATALQDNPALRPIRFGPGLLVFLDQLKESKFLRSWENSIVQETP
ncbi:iron(III) transport system substrate-binding protein [Litoreibacter meonggei]|uniref:Iron(III) transport system substrate-binding protein n=1 Tax=Litoreibacter meonggei TaxID=1049199 RepID=A0A497X3F3_9RHOB|nr:extracellular solute-binding protein [Litoreibacter meonggei]RLJ59509.1 iron(III) transport system substrate-binding protein [Litoreibacter meonggei]